MPAGRISSATWCSSGPLVRRSKMPWAPGDTWRSISSAGWSPCWPRLDSARVPPFRAWARAGRSPPSWARSWSPTRAIKSARFSSSSCSLGSRSSRQHCLSASGLCYSSSVSVRSPRLPKPGAWPTWRMSAAWCSEPSPRASSRTHDELRRRWHREDSLPAGQRVRVAGGGAPRPVRHRRAAGRARCLRRACAAGRRRRAHARRAVLHVAQRYVGLHAVLGAAPRRRPGRVGAATARRQQHRRSRSRPLRARRAPEHRGSVVQSVQGPPLAPARLSHGLQAPQPADAQQVVHRRRPSHRHRWAQRRRRVLRRGPSASSIPAARVLPRATAAAIAGVAADAARAEHHPDAAAYREALARSSFVRDLLAHRLTFDWAGTRMLSDDPAKGLGRAPEDALLWHRLKEILGAPMRELRLVSPYFVPGSAGVEALAGIARQGVKVAVLTNALEATDVAAVHAGYAKRRKSLLAAGITLFELKRGSSGSRKRVDWTGVRAPAPRRPACMPRRSPSTIHGCSSDRSTSIPVRPGST